jgi:RND superfamily putative drug exporter
MHEEWLKTGSNREAVRRGLAQTGKTITAAAAIMIFVFGSFILGGERVIKEFGLGLAGGVFVDAVIIRMAIVPAVMNSWLRQLGGPRGTREALPTLALEDDGESSQSGPSLATSLDGSNRELRG